MKPLGAAVVGLGFMGRIHARAYQAAAASGLPCELVAVCDRDQSRLRGDSSPAGNLATGGESPLFDPAVVRAYTDIDALLADPRISLVSICTYTDTHAEVAAKALRAGKHVLVEKPVAVGSAPVRALARDAAASGRLCMPGMCMRFWNGWPWLRDRIREQAYGRLRSLQFQRMGAGPAWGKAFYADYARSGGPLWDLHIHDSDFIYWCLGKPRSVSSTGGPDHLTTLYRFDAGPDHVAAEGGWDLHPAAGFRMKYLAAFERATAEFDLARGVTLHTDTGSQPVLFDDLSAYDHEIRHFVDAGARSRPNPVATMADAVAVAEILEAEGQSLNSGRTVEL